MPPSPAPDTCWCYLIRHGATEINLADPPRLQGRMLDAPLADIGERQAECTGRLLSSVAVQRVLTSPMLRARQTSERIAAPHGLEPEIVEELVEVDVGVWEGLPWDVIARDYPESQRRFLEDAGRYGYEGGENLQSVQARVVPVFTRLLAENRGRRIVVVAHNVVNRCYLVHLLGIPVSQYRIITQDNCGVTLLRHWEDKTKIVTLNAVFHLDGLG